MKKQNSLGVDFKPRKKELTQTFYKGLNKLFDY